MSALASRAALRRGAARPAALAHAADVLAMPSAYESYGLVVLEALACGVPVVATATGCVPDVVADGVNGAVVAGTPEDLAAGLSECSRCPPRLARAARATAVEHSWARGRPALPRSADRR